MNTESGYARLLVKRLDARPCAERSLLEPGAAPDEPCEGRVIAKDRASSWSLGIALGDRVSFAPHAGAELQIDGEQLLILRENDVLAVLG